MQAVPQLPPSFLLSSMQCCKIHAIHHLQQVMSISADQTLLLLSIIMILSHSWNLQGRTIPETQQKLPSCWDVPSTTRIFPKNICRSGKTCQGMGPACSWAALRSWAESQAPGSSTKHSNTFKTHAGGIFSGLSASFPGHGRHV